MKLENKISKWLVLAMFLGSFLPDSWGKACAALAAAMFVLKYIVPHLSGKMRYVYVIALPPLVCLALRHFSCMLWKWLNDVGVEKAFEQALHYMARLGDTGISMFKSCVIFTRTGNINHLSVLGTNFQFLIILVSIPLCIMACFRKQAGPGHTKERD